MLGVVGRRPRYAGRGWRQGRRLQLVLVFSVLVDGPASSSGETKSRKSGFGVHFTAFLFEVDVVQLSVSVTSDILHGVVGPLLVVRHILGFTAAASPARPAGGHEAGLRLRRLPLHHILCHKHGGGPLLGNSIDLTVNKYHDDPRCEEGHKTRGEDVPGLADEETLLPLGGALPLHTLWGLLFLRHEKWRRGDYDRYEPHYADHGFNPLWRSFAVVADGLRHGPVAVEADSAEVDDGRGAEEDVQRQVQRAPGGTKVPVAHDLKRQIVDC